MRFRLYTVVASQADLGPRPGESAHQEPWVTEDVVLERSKRILDGRSSQLHHLRSSSLLHSLQRVLVQVARDPTVADWQAAPFLARETGASFFLSSRNPANSCG
jgi:hypothetical protein